MKWNGDKLRRAREGVGATQDALAALAGCATIDVRRWESAKGRGEPRARALVELVAAMNGVAEKAGLPQVAAADLYDE